MACTLRSAYPGLLFGRMAARRGLRKIFKNSWDKDASLQSKSAETFWRAHFRLCNVTSTPVPLQFLPTACVVNQMAQGERTQCLRKLYMCDPTILNLIAMPHQSVPNKQDRNMFSVGTASSGAAEQVY